MSTLLLIAVPIPATTGQLILSIPQWIVGSKFRALMSWAMLIVFAYGSIELWWSMGVALWENRQFPGATALLVLGSMLPYMRGKAFKDRLKDPTVRGWERLRLWLLVFFMLGVNLGANVAYAIWASLNHIRGEVPFTWWDWAPLTIGFVAAVVIWVLKLRKVISKPAIMFNLAVFERIIPMAVIAVCAVLPSVVVQMPVSAAEGMFKIGLQAFILVLLERVNDWQKLERNELTSARFRSGWWGFSADLCNMAACTLLLIVL